MGPDDRLVILAIDDRKDNLLVLKAIIKDALPHAEVFTALSGREGIGLALAEDPDVILLDIVMPEMDGYEVCRQLKEDRDLKDTPVVFLTALRTSREDRIRALEVGAEAFLTKPLNDQELIAQIRAMVKIKEGNRLKRREKEELTVLVAERTHKLEEELEQRKKTEAALKESEEKYRSIFENAVEGIFQTTPEGRFITVNPAMAHMHGFASPEEMIADITDIGKQLYVNPEDRERYCAILEEKGEVNNFEAQVYRKDGNIIWTSVNARDIKDAAGNILRFEGTAENITKRKQAEHRSSESEKRYRMLFDEIDEGFCIIEVIFDENEKPIDYRFLEVNPSFGKQTGLIDAQGKRMRELAPKHEEHWFEIYGKIAVTGQPARFVKRAEQLHRWYDVYAFRFGKPENRQVAILFNDITERKRVEEELIASAEKLRKSLVGTIQVISTMLETRDPYTGGHQKRVSTLARAIAQDIGLSRDVIDTIRMAGTIHDIGKMSVPAEILSKPTKLSDIEMNIIKVHPQTGYDILKVVELPPPIAEIVLQHHERLDGSGYPQGLKDGEILLEAQIMSVADVVEAMASHRPYRPALGIDTALEEIEKNKGVLYNPQVVEVCVRLFREKGFGFD